MLNAIYPAARRLLFTLDAERAHHVSMGGLRLAERLRLLGALADRPPESDPVECMGLTFPNRVGLAAGLDKEANCLDALGRLGFGHLEVGTLTPRPQAGNAKPRLFRLPEHAAIINRMGFNNPGVDTGVANVRRARFFEGVLGVNIGKNKDTPNEEAVEDYLTCLRAAWPVADYIAVNLSSPNTPGLRDLQGADSAARLLERLKAEQDTLASETGKRVPLAFKVAPDLAPEDIAALGRVFREGGLEALIATNTTVAREGVAGHPHAEEAGGLSGAPLTIPSREVIAAFHAELGGAVPIIGVGGIMAPEHAVAQLEAGATLLQLYTGFIYSGPALIHSILRHVKEK